MLRTKILKTTIRREKTKNTFKVKLQIAAAGNVKTLLMGWRYGSRGRRQGSWKEHSGSQFSLTVLAPEHRVVLSIPGLELFYTGEECVKPGSRIREVNRMSA